MPYSTVTDIPQADFRPVPVVLGPEADGRIVVRTDWVVGEVRVTGSHSMSLGKAKTARALADRYCRAVVAGHGFTQMRLVVDDDGEVEPMVHARVSLLGRYLNADLRKLGF